MRYGVSVLFLAGAVSVLASPALGRLHELPGFAEPRHVEAIHRPTGCMARLDYEGEIAIAAFITDPICLPSGVRERQVPFYPRDFHVPAAYRTR